MSCVSSVSAHLAHGLYVVSREEPFHSVQDALTPAVVVPLGQVDHVSFLKGQFFWFARFVAVKSHHLVAGKKKYHNELLPKLVTNWVFFPRYLSLNV